MTYSRDEIKPTSGRKNAAADCSFSSESAAAFTR